MNATALGDVDQEVRVVLAQEVARLRRCPPTCDVADLLGLSVDAVQQAYLRLQTAHCLLLHPHSTEPWVVHPFALAPGACWVDTPRGGYWANCLYCAIGICAALQCDGEITTRLGGEAETVKYVLKDGRISHAQHVFHLGVPPRQWWDNVIYSCSSFQPFADPSHVAPWCSRHGMPQGYVMPMDTLAAFAADWYGAHLQRPWRKRSVEDVERLFASHGLTGDFWAMR